MRAVLESDEFTLASAVARSAAGRDVGAAIDGRRTHSPLDHPEYCKQTKPDVPSGTARELAELMGDVRKALYVLDVSQHVGDTTSLGADVAGSRVHAVRLPGITEAAVEVLFGLPRSYVAGQAPRPIALVSA